LTRIYTESHKSKGYANGQSVWEISRNMLRIWQTVTDDLICQKSPGILVSRAYVVTVGWGTKLQVGRSRVRFPMDSLEFFHGYNSSGRTMALWSTQLL